MSAAAGMRDRAAKLDDFHRELKGHGGSLKRRLAASAKDATGGDAALSGMGNDPKLGVTLRTERGRSTSSVTLRPSPKRAKAPWKWMQDGTRAGVRRLRRALRPSESLIKSRRGMQLSGIASYRHPGTKGKNAWFGVTDRELPKIAAELRGRFDVISR